MCGILCFLIVIGRCQKKLEEKLSSATNEVSEQQKRCQGLQEGIRALTDELQLMKSEIQDKVVALKKAETQNKTLSKRDKVCTYVCVCICVYACMRVYVCMYCSVSVFHWYCNFSIALTSRT